MTPVFPWVFRNKTGSGDEYRGSMRVRVGPITANYEGTLRFQIETQGPRKVRAEVIDRGVGFVPVPRDRPATDVGGWGLYLVQTLSNRWGVHEGRTHVWFEIDR